MQNKNGILSQLGLSGLIHVWGLPASGKTLFAVNVAANASRTGRIEWFNCDGKRSFVQTLMQVVRQKQGIPSNVMVSFLEDRESMLQTILALSKSLDDDVTLVVIDPLTRVLDMARTDPVLWGRELVEDVLPVLASLVLTRSIDVLIISESRTLLDRGTIAVHHSTIKRWSDFDVLVQRGIMSGRSELIIDNDTPTPRVLGDLVLLKSTGPDVLVRDSTDYFQEV
ncbi:MAG: hypothetical protein ACTSX2_06205 [Candidatus Thorarchaeota archaeon]